MLTLDKMEIQGFKSFYGRTQFEFRPGITAVVGPNGCGKSNIGDAISWVLGDQSPRSLRADRMADVIFNGSEQRKPMGMAEVTLRFQRANGGPEPPEVVVTRRLFRNGESEYHLNGSRCRLKDIQEMLIQSQVGTRLYSVMEQGKVDLILTAKPKDRRALFEEAAGILGYKTKRRIAEGKLEATQANLLRLHDILGEVTKQTAGLRRQVARARRYRKLQDAIRSRRGVLLRSRLAELDRDRDLSAAARRDLVDQETEWSAGLARAEAEVERLRVRFEEGTADTRRQQDRVHELDREMDRDRIRREQSLSQQEEARGAIERWRAEAETIAARVAEREARLAERTSLRDEAGGRLSALEAALREKEEEQRRRQEGVERNEQGSERVRSALMEALDRLAEGRSRAERLDQDLRRSSGRLVELAAEREQAVRDRERRRVEGEELAIAVEGMTRDLERLGGERAEAERQLAVQSESLQRIAGDLETLAGTIAQLEERSRSLDEDLSEEGRGAEAILGAAREGRFQARGRVADTVEVPPDYLSAAEAALGDFLEAVVVTDSVQAMAGVRFLRESRKGRCGFLAPGGSMRPVPAELLSEPGCLGRLAEKVRVGGECGEALRPALEGAILVSDLESALDLHRRYPEWSFVTVEGDRVDSAGLIQGGSSDPVDSEKGLLSRRRTREELAGRLGSAREDRDRRERERETAELSRRRLGEHVASLDERVRQRDHERVEARLRLAQIEEEILRVEKTLQVSGDEVDRLNAEGRELENERERLAETIVEAEAHRRERESEIAAFTLQVGSHREEMTAGAESLGAFRSQVEAEREKIRAGEEEIAAWERAVGEERERAERAGREAVAASERVEALRVQAEALTVSLERGRRERGELAAAWEKGEADLAALRTELLTAERIEKESRAGREEARRRVSEAEVEVARQEVERKHLETTCREEMALSLAELQELPLAEGDLSADAVEQEIAQLKARLDRLGAVNLVALEQYQEMEQRQQFLSSQKKDLEEAIESLLDTIRRINRTSREKFLDAFQTIQEGFNRSFLALFGGGKAELRLMEDEDILECGIEISASPPGKRLQSISLLSGGEKAMTAVALLFALFRFRPSPFCVLDEVDAPLDEANVGRFTRMLRDLTPETQFILITHNRRSMEAADLLYGITMEEPGVSKVVSMSLDH